MSEANADIKYDPELPFAVVIEDYPSGYVILGRCSTRQYAEDLLRNGTILRKIIDTTPKPKIPEDAQHITWGTETLAFSRYIDDLWYGWNYGHGLSDEELLEMIGNSEVTVLVRK